MTVILTGVANIATRGQVVKIQYSIFVKLSYVLQEEKNTDLAVTISEKKNAHILASESELK